MRDFYGIDMNSHRSKLLTAEDVNNAFLIIPVRRDLGSMIAHLYPESRTKLQFFRQNVADPWHQPVEVFRKCAEMMDDMLDDIVAILKNRL